MASTLLTGIVSYYKLDGDSLDAVGTNNGTDTVITYSLANGKINQGAGFDGTSSNIAGLPAVNNATPDDYSFSFWVNFADITVNSTIFDEYDTTPKVFIVDFVASTGIRFVLSTTSGISLVYPVANIVVNTWYHVVVTLENIGGAPNATLYVNGVSIASGSDTYNTTYTGTTTLQCGRTLYNGTYSSWLNGKLDEIGKWSRALTSTEITELYNSGAGLQYPFAPPVTVHPSFLLNFLT